MFSPREMAQAAPRRLVAHILPRQSPDEPSAAEVKLRMIRRLEELKRDGIGGSTLARLLASLKQQQPAAMGDDRAVRLLRLTLAARVGGQLRSGPDPMPACSLPQAATIQAAYRGRRARRTAGARRPLGGKSLNSPAGSPGNPATPPSTPQNRPGSAARVTPDGRPLSPSSRSLASLATPPGLGVELFKRRGSFGSAGSCSPPGSAGSGRGIRREPSWVGTAPLGFDSSEQPACPIVPLPPSPCGRTRRVVRCSN